MRGVIVLRVSGLRDFHANGDVYSTSHSYAVDTIRRPRLPCGVRISIKALEVLLQCLSRLLKFAPVLSGERKRRMIRTNQTHKRIVDRRRNLIKRPAVTTNSTFEIALACFSFSRPAPATSNFVSQQQTPTNAISITLLILVFKCSQTPSSNLLSIHIRPTATFLTQTIMVVSRADLTHFFRTNPQTPQFSINRVQKSEICRSIHISRNDFPVTTKRSPSCLTNGDSLTPPSRPYNHRSPSTQQDSLKGRISSQHIWGQQTTSPQPTYPFLISPIGTASKSNKSWQVSFTEYMQSILSKRPRTKRCCETISLRFGPLGQNGITEQYPSRPPFQTTWDNLPIACPPSNFWIQSMVRVLKITQQVFLCILVSLLFNSTQTFILNQTLRSTTILPTVPLQLLKTHLTQNPRKGKGTINMGARVSSDVKNAESKGAKLPISSSN